MSRITGLIICNFAIKMAFYFYKNPFSWDKSRKKPGLGFTDQQRKDAGMDYYDSQTDSDGLK